MGIFNVFRKPAEQVETRDSIIAEIPAENTAEALSLTFGLLFGNRGNMSLSAVYAAVELISNAIAQLPINVRIQTGEEKEIFNQHPAFIAMHECMVGKFILIKQLIRDMFVNGNGYAYIVRTSDGTISDIVYLRPSQVECRYDEQRRKLDYLCPTITSKAVSPLNMIHVVKNTYNGIQGKSLLDYADRAMKLSDACEESAKQYFSAGGNLSGVLKVNGPLSEKQRKDMLSNWRQTYGSGNNTSGGIVVLGANADYLAIQSNASDQQLLETRHYNLSEIARFFNISPVLLGDLSHSGYSTIEQANIQFLMHTLQPIITILETELNRKLIKDDEKGKIFIDIDETAFLRTDKTSEANYYTQLVNNGVITRNEARKKLGYAPVEGGDTLVIPYTDIQLNTFTEDKLNKEPEE